MLHTFDPFAFKLWNDFGIRWYGLSYLTGFAAAYFVVLFLTRRGLTKVPTTLVSDFIFTVAIGTIIGGRLGYCIFYSPELLTRFTDKFPFWGVLAVNEGGMASHGGIAGIIAAAYLFARRHKLQALHLIDLCALTGPIGVFFGRLANFINGELVGRPCEKLYAWCVKFPQDIYLWPSTEPQRLLTLTNAAEASGYSKTAWQSLVDDAMHGKAGWGRVDGVLSSIIQAIQNGSSAVADAISPVLTARHPSQLYEAGLEGIFLFCFLAFVWARPQKPGTIMGSFLSMYSIVRIVGEQFRMPDAHIGYQALNLTRGQWLSIAMLVIGLIVLIASSRRDSEKIGGWAKRSRDG